MVMRKRPGGWLPLASVAALVAAVGLLLYKNTPRGTACHA